MPIVGVLQQIHVCQISLPLLVDIVCVDGVSFKLAADRTVEVVRVYSREKFFYFFDCYVEPSSFAIPMERPYSPERAVSFRVCVEFVELILFHISGRPVSSCIFAS